MTRSGQYHEGISVRDENGAVVAYPAHELLLPRRILIAIRAVARTGAVVLSLVGATAAAESVAQGVGQVAGPIKDRNTDVTREGATALPRSEADQAVVNGWPLYRTPRGQAAFNDAMATLKATDSAPPALSTFEGCRSLDCNLSLPSLGSGGWIPAGRIWVSPTEFVLFVHTPRFRDERAYPRRASKNMTYFVFHEFHSSTRNTDPYDTISSHSGSVFVPLYMSKQYTDAKGRQFVIVLQVAPFDVVSIHASNRDSAGPGMEVAKNPPDTLEPLQGLAGILVATIIKSAAPQLQVVNHQDAEGLPMLRVYEHRLASLRARPAAANVVLPFVAASAQRVATATASLEDLIVRRDMSPHRSVVPPLEPASVVSEFPSTPPLASLTPAPAAMPVLIEPIRPAVRPTPAPPSLIEPMKPVNRPALLPDTATSR
jgi:hypothetical protein